MLLKLRVLAFALAGLGPVAAQAMTIDQIGGPANPPPPGYRGDQFVDSRGCIFMRAGYAGSVSWVPRALRNRQVLCGYQPTRIGGRVPPAAGAGGAAAAQMATQAPAAPPVAPPVAHALPMATVASGFAGKTPAKPSATQTASAAATPAAAIAAPAARPVRPAAPVMNRIIVRDGSRTYQAESRRVLVRPAGRMLDRPVGSLCEGLGTAETTLFRLYDGREALRCASAAGGPARYAVVPPVPKPVPAPLPAPQVAPEPAARVAAARPAPPSLVAARPAAGEVVTPARPPEAVVVPRRVVVATPTAPVRTVPARTVVVVRAPVARAVRSEPAPRAVTVAIPPGYKPGWTDGRLNPLRGVGTAAGQAAMDQIWTKTVPRRLIGQKSGGGGLFSG